MTLKEALQDLRRLLTVRPTRRVSIPSLFITVPLYTSNGKNAQEIVDNSASAVWLEWPNFPAIADHRSQRFYRLPNARPYFTVAYITEIGKPETSWICTDKYLALIKDGTLVSERDGSDIIAHKNVKLLMYTCSGKHIDGNTEVWATEWDRIK